MYALFKEGKNGVFQECWGCGLAERESIRGSEIIESCRVKNWNCPKTIRLSQWDGQGYFGYIGGLSPGFTGLVRYFLTATIQGSNFTFYVSFWEEKKNNFNHLRLSPAAWKLQLSRGKKNKILRKKVYSYNVTLITHFEKCG